MAIYVTYTVTKIARAMPADIGREAGYTLVYHIGYIEREEQLRAPVAQEVESVDHQPKGSQLDPSKCLWARQLTLNSSLPTVYECDRKAW